MLWKDLRDNPYRWVWIDRARSATHDKKTFQLWPYRRNWPCLIRTEWCWCSFWEDRSLLRQLQEYTGPHIWRGQGFLRERVRADIFEGDSYTLSVKGDFVFGHRGGGVGWVLLEWGFVIGLTFELRLEVESQKGSQTKYLLQHCSFLLWGQPWHGQLASKKGTARHCQWHWLWDGKITHRATVMGKTDEGPGSQGSTYRRKRYSTIGPGKACRIVLEHLVRWWIHLWGTPSSCWIRLGDTRKKYAQGRQGFRPWPELHHLPSRDGDEDQGEDLVSYLRTSTRVPGYPQRIGFHFWLLHSLGVAESDFPTYMSLCLPPNRCHSQLSGVTVSLWKGTGEMEDPIVQGNNGRFWRTGSSALWARQERLLVRFATEHGGNREESTRAERDGAASDLGNPGGHDLGSLKPEQGRGLDWGDGLQKVPINPVVIHRCLQGILYRLDPSLRKGTRLGIISRLHIIGRLHRVGFRSGLSLAIETHAHH